VFISGVHIFSKNPSAISKYLVPEGGQKNKFYTDRNKY